VLKYPESSDKVTHVVLFHSIVFVSVQVVIFTTLQVSQNDFHPGAILPHLASFAKFYLVITER
jgi:hypothetical protein